MSHFQQGAEENLCISPGVTWRLPLMVPNGSANVEKQRPSYFLLSHASHLRCDRGCGLGPKGVCLAFQGAG